MGEPIGLLDIDNGPRFQFPMTEEEKQADERALQFTYPRNPDMSALPSSWEPDTNGPELGQAYRFENRNWGESLEPAKGPGPELGQMAKNAGGQLLSGAAFGAKHVGKAGGKLLKGTFKGAKAAAPIVMKGTKKTAGKIMSALGAMGGGVHKARKADQLVEKSMERGRVRKDI